ncbi:MAG: putative sulfate exporter family transporter [Bdellovibrionales bacterium]|nr:putative sulfate exporter family transporter [Bdellovibrionales bacterium]
MNTLKALIPGWLLLGAIALISQYASKLLEVGGKNPLEAAVIAIVLGVTLRNTGAIPLVFEKGVKAFEKPLALGIVLLGSALNYYDFFGKGLSLIVIVLGTMGVGLFSIVVFSRLLKLPRKLSLLLALGTTICGGTAIAIVAPLMKADEEETSYAIGVIALWGLLALLLYPAIARLLGIPDEVFGVFAGTAIHSTPQVVGAGFMYSDAAGTTATAVKLLRNCLIAPAAFGIAIWFAKETASAGEKISTRKIVPWFLFGYFLLAFLSSEGILSKELSANFTSLGKFFVLVGMAGVGCNTRLSAFKSLGLKPLLVGFVGAVVVAITSIALIRISL